MTADRTKLYALDFPGGTENRLDRVIRVMAKQGIVLQGSGVRKHSVFVMYRAENDDTAATIAYSVAEGASHVVSIGLGIHKRIVEESS